MLTDLFAIYSDCEGNEGGNEAMMEAYIRVMVFAAHDGDNGRIR